MCDTVLSCEKNVDAGGTTSTPGGVGKADAEKYYNHIHTNVFSSGTPVASGPQINGRHTSFSIV